MGEEQRNKEAPQDFRMRYRVIIDDIKYIKSRQWAVTYYLLLLFAAIISFHHLVNPVYPWQEKILTFIAILVAALGTFYLMEFQYRLSRYRERLVDIVINKKKLSEDFRIYEKNLNDDIDEYKSWWKGFPGFTLPFILMLWVGAFFTLWDMNMMKNIELIPFLENILNSLGYSFIVIGSLGMIFFATKFPSSTRIKDLKHDPHRLFKLKCLNGWRVWKWSWILILVGSIIQIILVWMI